MFLVFGLYFKLIYVLLCVFLAAIYELEKKISNFREREVLVVTQDQDGKPRYNHWKQVGNLQIECCLRTTLIKQQLN